MFCTIHQEGSTSLEFF